MKLQNSWRLHLTSKISQILKESHTPQVQGDLIKYDFDTGEFEGKCALGVLACESGDSFLKLSKDHQNVQYDAILNAYGIADEAYPMLVHPKLYSSKETGWDFNDQTYLLSHIIIRLNDTFNFSFKEIGEFLEETFDL